MQSYGPPVPKDSRGPLLLQVIWVGVAISSIVLAARLWSRIKHLGRLFPDDYFMITALVCGILSGALANVAVNSGFGQHYLNLELEQVVLALKYQYIAQPFASLALVFGRVSFAVSLITIIGINRFRRIVLYTLIVGELTINILAIGLQLGECNPPAAYWDPRLQATATCLSPNVIANIGYLQGSWDILTDLVLALLPVFVIVQLNLKPRVRAGLVFLMGLGVFNTGAAIATIVLAAKAGAATDITYDYIIIDVWGVIQTYLAIVIASLPFCVPIFRSSQYFHLGFYRSWFRRSYGTGSRGKTPTPPFMAGKEWYPMDDSPSQNTGGGGSEKSDVTENTLSVPTPRLPTIKRDRFATTTLMNAGRSIDGFEAFNGSRGSEVPTHRASMEFKEAVRDEESF